MNNEEIKSKCVGRLFVGMVAHIKPDANGVSELGGISLKLMSKSRQIVEELDAAGELGPLIAAFGYQS